MSNTALTCRERSEIAEILSRRANEIATYAGTYQRDAAHFGSVAMALSREIERLRTLATRIQPPEPIDYDSDE